jgi:hypothetical protein
MIKLIALGVITVTIMPVIARDPVFYHVLALTLALVIRCLRSIACFIKKF